MKNLTVVDVDGLSLVVSDDDGNQATVEIDEATLGALRSARMKVDAPRVSPREIQARIRAGLTAEDVAAVTGASIETVRRYEGPVLAEREYMLTSALAVATSTSVENEQGEETSAFGAVIRARLAGLAATTQRWVSWREDDGTWIIKVEFTANEIEHDARWSYEPRKQSLTALNSDAASLSQKADLSSGLIPKLRAVDTGAQATATSSPASSESAETELPTISPAPNAEEVSDEPIPASNTGSHSPTADLLEALRKRRSERDNTPEWLRETVRIEESVSMSDNGVVTGMTVNIEDTIQFTEPFDLEPHHDETTEVPAANDSKPVNKTGRVAMPSWDDIVFGTRSDEDPA